MRTMRRIAVARALSLVVACLPLPAFAAFERLYVFGDSLSEIAIADPAAFDAITAEVKKALGM